jgi:Peptidase A4 family
MNGLVARRAYAAIVAGGVAGVLACTPASGAVMRHATDHRVNHSTSSNWAGYAVTGSRFTSVSASWTQPAVDCSATPSGWSSFWVGLDGDKSDSVEQTGTEADCQTGQPVYGAWYEMYPEYPKDYADPVSPGDRFTATVTTDGAGGFTLTLADETKGWTQTKTLMLASAKLASAEIVAEAPSGRTGPMPLADFGTVAFDSNTVNGAPLTSATPGLEPITMGSGAIVKAQPSAMGPGSFSVTWQHS